MRREGKKLAQVARIQARGLLYIPSADQPDGPEEFDEALALFGLRADAAPDDVPEPEDKCYLWPCNVAAWNLWGKVQTQWRVGMEGRTGLDYAGVCAYLVDVLGLKRQERAELFKGLQAMEVEALNVWAQQRT